MARQLRLEFAGALYHLTARGNERQEIFRDNGDRQHFLAVLAREVRQLRWRLHAYCLMGNHYHLLVETPEPNLARGMKRLNSVYSQRFNQHHNRVGHLFQGRYHSVLVQKESYLLELSRYIVLNPVRAGVVAKANQWPWSSYRATAGLIPDASFLEVRWLLEHFHPDLRLARDAYRRFIDQDDVRCPWNDLRGGVWLGSESFRELASALLKGKNLRDVPRAQQQPLRPTQGQVIACILDAFAVTEPQLWKRVDQEAFQAAIYLLRRAVNIPIRDVARLAGVSASRISTIQRRIEDGHRSEKLNALLGSNRFQISDSGRRQRYKVKLRPQANLRLRLAAGVPGQATTPCYSTPCYLPIQNLEKMEL